MLKKNKKYYGRKPKNSDLNDLIAVFIVALIALLNYDSGPSIGQGLTTSLFPFFIIIILLALPLFFTGRFFFNSNKLRSEDEQKIMTEDTQIVKLYWSQAFQHDILIYFIPLLVMLLPLFSGQSITFMDILQAAMAFGALVYLKILYWNKFFSF